MKNKLLTILFTIFTFLFFSNIASAIPGNLDLTFNGTGYRTDSFGTNPFVGAAVAIQKDGKIVVAGYQNVNCKILVIRYNTNGSLDTTFAGTGYVLTSVGSSSVAHSVAIQSDGKIVVAGSTFNGSDNDAVVLRYKTNGFLDSTFDGDGIATANFGYSEMSNSVAIQPDGKIVVGGDIETPWGKDILLMKFETNGSFDFGFGFGGFMTTDLGTIESAGKITLQSDGKIVATGTTGDEYVGKIYVARYDEFGWLDGSFNTIGYTIYYDYPESWGMDVKVQTDGKIVVAGMTMDEMEDDRFSVIRFKANGSLDPTFGTNGTFRLMSEGGNSSYSHALEIQADGKIVAVGNGHFSHGTAPANRDFVTARILSNGTLDTSFGTSGVSTLNLGTSEFANDVAIQLNGKIVVTGKNNSKVVTARYEAF